MQRRERDHPPTPIHTLPSGEVQVLIPDIGDGSKMAKLLRWMVAPGDSVRKEQPIAEMQYEKASVEIPSPRAGTVLELDLETGQSRGLRCPLLTLR